MEFIGLVKEVSQARVLQGNTGDVKIVDVLVDGGDVIMASAFDKVADMFTNESIKVGSLAKLRITASVRDTRDGKRFQSLRIEAATMLFDPNQAF